LAVDDSEVSRGTEDVFLQLLEYVRQGRVQLEIGENNGVRRFQRAP